MSLRELRFEHVENTVKPIVNQLIASLDAEDHTHITAAFQGARVLLEQNRAFCALSFDALRYLVPNATLAPWGLSWPTPADMPLAAQH